jgi:splicing factor 1
METKSLAKIAIRGKGSVKEGKGKSDAAHASNQDEDLHCLIMADTEEKIAKAKELIHQVIETVSHIRTQFCAARILTFSQAASIPEGQNELKRNQLRELAALNGTLRDDENQACQNCGEIGHRKYDCPNAKNFTANIICRVCGNAGHFARDCTERARGSDWRNLPARGPGDAADKEYENLMNEIGGGTAGNPSRQIGWQEGGAGAGPPPAAPGGPDLKPWQRGPQGGPAPWEINKPSNPSGPAPWQQRPAPSGPSGGAAPWEQRSGGYDRDQRGGGGESRGPAPWQQPRAHDRGQDNYNGGGYGGGGYGGAGRGYGQGAPAGGPAPWNQPQQHAGYGAPGMDNYGAPPPPPPPGNIPPPPPPSDYVPPPPPPPQ